MKKIMKKIKSYKLFTESSSDYSYLTEEIDGVNITAEAAHFSTVNEFGYVSTEILYNAEDYDVKFLVVQPSDGSPQMDLWYIKPYDDDDIENCTKMGIKLDDNGRVSDEDISDFILEAYDNVSNSSIFPSEYREDKIGEYEIKINEVDASHIIETGYVMVTCEKDGEEYDVTFDVIQHSDSDWFVALEEDSLKTLNDLGLNVEVQETEFTGGYTYNCIKGDDFNFILDWYDSICNHERPDWR